MENSKKINIPHTPNIPYVPEIKIEAPKMLTTNGEKYRIILPVIPDPFSKQFSDELARKLVGFSHDNVTPSYAFFEGIKWYKQQVEAANIISDPEDKK